MAAEIYSLRKHEHIVYVLLVLKFKTYVFSFIWNLSPFLFSSSAYLISVV